MSFFEDASLVLIPSGIKNQKIYSVKPTDGTGDLTFSRASSATRVASNGLIEKVRTNLFKYSEQFNQTSAWSFQGGATISANAGIAPDGTTTADLLYPSINGSVVAVIQAITSASSVEYTQSVYVKASGKNFVGLYTFDGTAGAAMWVNLTTGAITNGVGVNVSGRFATNVGNGWWRIGFTDIGNGTTTYMHVYPTDAASSNSVTANGTDGILLWGAQLETGVATDYIATTTAAVSVGPVSGLPRLDYLGSTCPRLLLEPQRTNLVTYSEQFDNADWIKSNATVTANTSVSPDGYTNADTVVITTGGYVYRELTSYSAVSGQSAAISVFAKNQTNNFLIFGGATPAGTDVYKIENYGNGWYRHSVVRTFTTTTTGSLQYLVATEIVGTHIVWGAQIEGSNSAYATSYIPTLGASVTRVADAASKTGISSLIGQTEGTIFAEIYPEEFVEGSYIGISDGANISNRIIFGFEGGSANSGTFQVYGASGLTGSGTYTRGQRMKVAIGYKSGSSALYVNGNLVNSSTSTFTTTFTKFGFDSYAGTQNFVGKCSQLLISKTRLSNSDLAALTA
jgi:hypothetical protein